MIIKEIKKNEAENFFKQYEHLGNCGLGVWHYGLYDDDALLSVVSFGPTNFNPNRCFLGKISEKYSVKIIQLTRGGTKFDADTNIPSFIIKRAMNEIKCKFGDCIIVAYSDTKWNEVGTIYQASNFLYCGLTEPKGQSNYMINGKKYSGWTVRKIFGTRDMKKLLETNKTVERIPLTKKHMYLYVKAPKMKKRLIMKALKQKYDFENLKYPNRIDLEVGSMNEIHMKMINN